LVSWAISGGAGCAARHDVAAADGLADQFGDVAAMRSGAGVGDANTVALNEAVPVRQPRPHGRTGSANCLISKFTRTGSRTSSALAGRSMVVMAYPR
jgi:hypothetical protein